jgi:hypothetical protein
MNSIYQLLNPDNTISFNRPLAHAIGLMETVVYGALIAKWNYYRDRGMLDKDGWFYSTIADLEESTSLSDKQQKRCTTALEKLGMIKCRQRGMPAKRSFYIIDDVVLLAKLLDSGEKKMSQIKPMTSSKTGAENENNGSQTALLPCSAQMAKQETLKWRNKELPNGETSNAQTAEQETPKQRNKKLPNGETSNTETAEQETPKRRNKFLPNVEPCYAQTADKSKANKSKANNLNIINPINQSTDSTDRISELMSERATYSQIVRENTDYDCLIEQNPDKADRINELMSVMVDVICSTKSTVRVNGEDIPHEVVKSVFLKLDSSHIEYVLQAMNNTTSDVRNIRSYLITALYNAPSTLSSYWGAVVNRDMASI